MLSTISLHDHFIREFCVDPDAKSLRLRTAWPRAAGPSFAEALFEGLEGYTFIGDALGTIILDIEEVDTLALYDEFADALRQAYAQTGAHAPWVTSREEAQAFLHRRHVKGYRLSASIGLTGALWAGALATRWIVAPRATEPGTR